MSLRTVALETPRDRGLGDGLGRDGLRGLHVLLDDCSQHCGSAVDCVHDVRPRSDGREAGG